MSDIDIPVSASGEEGINKIVSAIDRMHSSLEKLGNVSGLSRLEQQMKEMQASMTTGFAELASLAKKGGAEVVAAHQATSNKVLSIEQKRDVELNRMRQQSNVDYVRFWEKQLATVEAGMQAELAARASAYAVQNALQQRRDIESYNEAASAAMRIVEIQQKRDTEMHVEAQRAAIRLREIQQKRDLEEYQEAAAQSARLVAIQQARDVELNSMRQRAAAEAAALAEKQRVLNTNFMTASPASQLNTARQAQAYGSLGGNAAERYGSQAASADIRALTAAHERLQQTVPGSTRAIENHTHAMNEAHSLARGLAGSLGGLWLTYGSVVPLLAGAAIAASLKNIVTVGAEVENQLNFVFALSEKSKGVDLNQFLTVTDSSLRSVTESANAMRALAQNGLEASQSLQVLPAILDLATVGEMSVAQAAIAATGATAAFGLSFAEAGRVADIFAKTAATSNTSVIAITESMKQASTVASLFKVSIEETAGVLGVLAKINVTGGAAGTSMTNMLNGLYEPTEKGKRALKELGLETTTATGALKPFTQVMEEMRTKLSGFNDSAKVDILGSIFTVRGLKAVQQVQENLGEYKQKVLEASTASGYMREVVEKLEDSTTGAFTRLGVTVQNTFVKSFSSASPYVQALALHLGDMFKEGGTAQTGITNFATNVAKLTGALVDNLGVVTALGVGFVGFRALGPVIALFQAATTATAASTLAQTAATAASIAHTSALAGGASTMALFTAATETQAAATAAATAASAAWGAVLLPALAAVAIAVAGGAALWLLFRDNTTEADTANTKISNSLHVVTDALDKEIERLEKSNALWNERTGRFREAGSVTPELIDRARGQVSSVEAKIRKEGLNPDDVRNAGVQVDSSGIVSSTGSLSKYADALTKADLNLEKLIENQDKFNKIVQPGQNLEKAQQQRQQLQGDLERFAKQSSEVTDDGVLVQGNEKIRELYRKAGQLVDKMPNLTEAASQGPEQLKAAVEQMDKLNASYKVLKDQVNAEQSGRTAKPAKGAAAAARDEANAQVKELEYGLQLQRKMSEAAISTAKLQNGRGELGDLQLINVEKTEKLKIDAKALEVAKAQSEVEGLSKSKVQGFENKVGLAKAQSTIDSNAESEKRRNAFAAMAEDERAFEAQTLRDKGQLVDAYDSDYKAKHGTYLANLAKDIEGATDETEKNKLVQYQKTLKQMEEYGRNAALGDQIAAQFGLAMNNLQFQLQGIADQNGPGTGLASVFDNALASEQAFAAALPELMKRQAEMQAVADASKNPKDKQDALQQLAAIRAQATQMRNQWVSVGDAIANSMTKAFGKSGTALGGMLKATVAYGIKRKQIDDDYAKADKSTMAKKAQADAQAYNDITISQISAYSDVTSAAKGFFQEGSKGYKAMEVAEKGFRAIELGLAIQNAVQKSGLVAAFTSLFVTSKGTEVAATQASVAPDVAASMIKGQAAAAVGVASQAQGDPYTAWARMAAMAAVMAALGFAVGHGGGSGGGKSAAKMQEEQGTGSVFGNSKAKSDSIGKSLEILNKHTGDLIPINLEMLNSLRAIEASMTGLTNLVVRVPGLVEGTNMGIKTGVTNKSTGASIAAGAQVGSMIGSYFGPIGMLVGGLLGGIVGGLKSIWGKTKANIVDSGLQFGGSVRSLQSGQGFNQYASVDTTKSSWFGLSKKTTNSTQTEGLNSELSSQFGLIFKNLEKSLDQAAIAMGGSADQVGKVLDGLKIDTTSISLKGLSGEALTSAINSVISKAMDQMAEATFPALDQFRQVGEGYAETVVRLASDYAVLDASLKSIGTTFGATGTSSLAARENLIELVGGLDNLTQMTKSFSDNFLTEAERLAPVQKYVTEQLASLGITGLKTRDDFKNVVLGLTNSGALTTVAGSKLFASLMQLQGAFAEVTPPIKDLTKSISEIADEARDLQNQLDDLTMTRVQLLAKEREQLDPSNRALFDQIQRAKAVVEAKDNLNAAYENEKNSIEDTISRLSELGTSWKKFRDGLMLGDKSILTPEQKYAEARRQYDTTLAAARGGDKDAQGRMEEVANAFLEASRISNSSSEAYTTDFNKVISSTDEAIQWASQQVDVARQSLVTLEAQLAGLIDIKVAVMTVAEALAQLAARNAEYAANVPPPPPPPPPVVVPGANGSLTPAQIERLIDELGNLHRLGEQTAQANIDAMYASAQQGAAVVSQSIHETVFQSNWNQRNYTEIQ